MSESIQSSLAHHHSNSAFVEQGSVPVTPSATTAFSDHHSNSAFVEQGSATQSPTTSIAAQRSTSAQTSNNTESDVDIRLNTLRETVLQILDEVESLAISVPVDLKNCSCFSDEVRQFEVNLIRAALGRTSGSQTQAARLLGLKPTTLNAKIKRYNISPSGYHAGAERENAA